jgi:hypothetical protein
MLSDKEIDSLPDDPLEAFVEYVEKLKAPLAGVVGNDAKRGARREFVDCVRAYTDTYDVGHKFGVPPQGATSFDDYFSRFTSELNYIVTKIKLQTRRATLAGAYQEFTLSTDFRLQIHEHLEVVRKIVLAAELEERLAENILSKLNALSAEVDKGRSGLQRFTVAFVEVCAAIGEGANKLEPAVKKLERVAGLLGKSKKENDVKQLTGGEKQKLIEGPQAEEEGSSSNDDEEIPF